MSKLAYSRLEGKMHSSKPIVGYVRVSTREQGQSGLGLEAQEHALGQYVESVGGRLL